MIDLTFPDLNIFGIIFLICLDKGQSKFIMIYSLSWTEKDTRNSC